MEVGVRELRNHTADVIAAIQSGQTVYLTSHRRRIAVITPVDGGTPDPLAELLQLIDATPATDSGLADAVAESRARDAQSEGDPWS